MEALALQEQPELEPILALRQEQRHLVSLAMRLMGVEGSEELFNKIGTELRRVHDLIDKLDRNSWSIH